MSSAVVFYGNKYSYEHIPLGPEKPAWYAEKVNPRGTVPALQIREGKVLMESMWVAEYIDATQPLREGELPLVPTDAEQAYDAKLFIDEFGKNCMGAMYRLLKNQDPAADATIAEEIAAGVAKLNSALEAQSEGPFFLGARFSIADVAVAPFLHRFKSTLTHFRGFDPLAGDGLARARAWLDACEARESFKTTALPGDEYVRLYSVYAGERGASEFGK